jgi:hypothetical protein
MAVAVAADENAYRSATTHTAEPGPHASRVSANLHTTRVMVQLRANESIANLEDGQLPGID